MKRLRNNIRLLALGLACLFVGLVAYFSYSVYFYGGRWFASATNPRLADQKQHVIMGDLVDRTGLVLATTDADGQRSYPQYSDLRRAVSHVVGDSGGVVANGAETFMASYLLGFESGAFERLRLLFTGEQARGDTVRLTIDAKLCEYASSLLSRHEGGAIVVMNYRTGELLCSTSYPDFDPRSLSSVLQNSEDNGALINRVTQGLYPPGSTFKILTLASALENISGVMSRTYNCTGALTVDRTTVTEASSQVHGVLSVQEAFAESCNTAFASLALELGYGRLAQTASSFGFGDNFLFRDLIVYNSQYPTDNQSLDDLAWSGVGQGRVLATPLHMAMVAAAVANDGVMMEPRLMLSATTAQGQSRTLQPTRTYRRACSAEIASALRGAMGACVQSGTGRQAQISGYTVGGKTGSAESSDDKEIKTHAWFVGFVESDEHPLAIAVVIEHGGSGGSIATPIAQRVLSRAIEQGY